MQLINLAMNKKIILFIHVPKTAGSTFKSILSNSLGLSFCNSTQARPNIITPKFLKTIRFLFPRLKAIGGHNIRLEGSFLSDKYFRITFIRDPIKRTISHFQHYCRARGINNVDNAIEQFDNWINNSVNQNHQIKKIGLTDDFDKSIDFINSTYDFIGLTEDFDVSMQILQQKCNVELDLEYTLQQTSKNSQIASAIQNSKDCLSLIKQHNTIDIKLYEYICENYFVNNYYKNYSYNRDQQMNINKPKHPFKGLIFKYYNRFIFRAYIKLFYTNRDAEKK